MNPRTLRKARVSAGYSYRQVGQAAGLDPTSICHYEAGKGSPSPAALSRWHRALRQLLAKRVAVINDISAIL